MLDSPGSRERYDTEQEDSLSSFMNMRKGLPKPITKLVREEVRWRVLTFLEFLNTKGFSTIRAVTANTINGFLEWCQSRGIDRSQLRDTLGSISVFLDWAGMAGQYNGMNPIQPRMHRLVKPERVPRPLRDQALARIWRTLDERGTLQQKLAVALGEEAGLRISEVCNLHMSDIDMQGHRIFVRVPNKTDSERWAFFHRKTRNCFVSG